MNEHRPTFWFPVKSYGWGWGLPVRWQGWVVLAVYFLSIYSSIKYFRPRHDTDSALLLFGLATVILIGIIVWKGEKPVAWRWGGK